MDIVLVLALGVAVSWLSRRWSFPAAVAQVLLGVLLGASVLGWVIPRPTLYLLGELGVVLLLGSAGLELGVQKLRDAGWAGIWVAVLGIVLSLAGGYVFSRAYGSPDPEALYIGLVLAATSIGITVQMLQQFGLVTHRVGEVVLAAAILDDVLALYLLATAHGVLSDDFAPARAALFPIVAIVTLAGAVLVSRALTRAAMRWRWMSHVGARTGWAVLLIVAVAVFTKGLGLSPVVGAFFAGLGVGEGLETKARAQLASALHPLVLVSAPFFFVLIGAEARWDVLAEPNMGMFLGGLLLVAFLGKTLGGVLGAVGSRGWLERWLIGLGMVPRGEVALIIATLGYQQGHLTHHVFVSMLLIALIAAVTAPLLMAPLARRLLRAQRE